MASRAFLLLALISAAYFFQSDASSSASLDNQSLKQASTSCPTNFAKVDFSEVTSVCKGPKYEEGACCAAFQKAACNHAPLVNDFSSTCPVEFMSFLNYAGKYPNGVFVGRCTVGEKLCSSA